MRFPQKTIQQRLVLKLRYPEILIVFTIDFAVRVRYPIFPGMTSSVSHDVIFFNENYRTHSYYLKYEISFKSLVRSRDIDVLV